MTAAPVPGSTPVLIGVAQHSERLGEPDYEALSPADLAARAAAAALADAGLDPSRVDVLACPRQFDETFPGMAALLGRPQSFTRAVAARTGMEKARTIYAASGGQSPQQLVTELAGRIASGEISAAIVVNSEAISTVLNGLRNPEPPDYTEDNGPDPFSGAYGDRQPRLEGIVTRLQVEHGLADAPTQYAFFEHARRLRLGLSRSQNAADMGRWMAPMTEVAAANPHAAVREVRTAEELVRVTEDNRIVSDPYPKAVVAREKVNQAAAVVLVSADLADELGVAAERRVHLRGHSDLRDREFLRRASLSHAVPAERSIRGALAMAGIGIDDLAWIDLYSCFPSAVSMVADSLGLSPDDPRGLTVTGGLPFFGGPGNGYSLHAICEVVERCRREPGSWGLVGANGGMMSKYSAGVYCTAPGPWSPGQDADVQAEIDAYPDHPVAHRADGWATLETFSVQYGDAPRVVAVARLDDGRRFVANDVDGDDEVRERLLAEHVGAVRVFARSTSGGNRVTLSHERMDELLPVATPGLDDDFAWLAVVRDGAVLTVTIRGTDERNVVTGEVSTELAGVFDAFEADPTLWVAILTGSGDRTFATDPQLTAEGATSGGFGLPTAGFGGLTDRVLTKPVIAALNGDAYGAGLELALAAHLTVVDERATVGMTQVRHGLTPAYG
jgi:acetyl-CoA C-acetyltransferase